MATCPPRARVSGGPGTAGRRHGAALPRPAVELATLLPTAPRPLPSPPWAVGKITGKEGLLFEGRALCFDCEEDMLAALERDQQQFRV